MTLPKCGGLLSFSSLLVVYIHASYFEIKNSKNATWVKVVCRGDLLVNERSFLFPAFWLVLASLIK